MLMKISNVHYNTHNIFIKCVYKCADTFISNCKRTSYLSKKKREKHRVSVSCGENCATSRRSLISTRKRKSKLDRKVSSCSALCSREGDLIVPSSVHPFR